MRFLALTYAEFLVGSHYRRLRLGVVPEDPGGMVLYTNHSNGLVDGQLSLFASQRSPSILAKASLFKIPILNWLIRQVGAIPIYRQKDNVDMALNEDSFREIHAHLLSGGALVIYPEGESRLGHTLRPFKTGAARMALGAQAKCDDAGKASIRFQPVAFVYEEQETFASRAHLWVGKSIDAQDFVAAYRLEERETVRKVTQTLRERLAETMVIARDPESFAAAVQIDRVLHAQPAGAPPRLKALAAEWDALREEIPDEVEPFRERLAQWTRSLQQLGLEGYDLTGPRYKRSPAGRLSALGTLIVTALLIPLWLPPVALARAIASIGRSTPDKLVTVTLISSSVFVPLWTIALAWWNPVGWGFGLSFLVTFLWALIALWWVRRAGRPRPLRRAWTRLGLQGFAQRVDSLWVEKQHLDERWRSLTGEDRLANVSWSSPR